MKASVGPLLVYFDYLTAFTAHTLNCPTSRSSEITSRLSNQSILMGGLLQLLLKICRFTFFLQTYLAVDKLTRQTWSVSQGTYFFYTRFSLLDFTCNINMTSLVYRFVVFCSTFAFLSSTCALCHCFINGLPSWTNLSTVSMSCVIVCLYLFDIDHVIRAYYKLKIKTKWYYKKWGDMIKPWLLANFTPCPAKN